MSIRQVPSTFLMENLGDIEIPPGQRRFGSDYPVIRFCLSQVIKLLLSLEAAFIMNSIFHKENLMIHHQEVIKGVTQDYIRLSTETPNIFVM